MKLKDREEGGVTMFREENMFINELVEVRSIIESPPRMIDDVF